MNGVVFCSDAYTDLDFADNICLLAELLSLLIPVLEAMIDEAAAIGLEVNWDKTSSGCGNSSARPGGIGRAWAPGRSHQQICLPPHPNTLHSPQQLRHSPLQWTHP